MFINGKDLPRKKFIAFAYVAGNPETERATLKVSGHTSLRMAKRGMDMRRNENRGFQGVQTYGWSEIEPMDREHGMVL